MYSLDHRLVSAALHINEILDLLWVLLSNPVVPHLQSGKVGLQADLTPWWFFWKCKCDAKVAGEYFENC